MPPRDPYLSTISRATVHGPLLRARDIHDAADAPAPGRPEVRLDPPRTTTAVRGRTRLLGELTAAMDAGAPVPHVLAGPHGVGTTTVAAALAQRAKADGRRVFWARAGDVSTGLLEAAVEVGGSPSEAERVRDSPQRAARWVWRQLDRAPEPWLLVLDNADRPEEIDPHHRPGDQVGWLRTSPAGFVLVTSRVDDPALWAPARMHSVAELDSAAAGAALADHAGEEALPGAEELAERLGGVPLALTLAGRILASHRVLFPDARALCKRLDEDGLEPPDGPLCEGRSLLSGIWDVALDLVSRREPKAPALLRLLAVLGSEGTPVPLGRLDPGFLRDEPLPLNDRPELARTVNALVVHGLVSVDDGGAAIDLRLHPLVSETLRAQPERCAPFHALADRIVAAQG
ncbi:ATP-binding protein [Nocardiopsis sp. HNM0947]|uniref:ATP-binding protein n=1 Tax=Nocardiopsis coralli TaxID=2772213 RepID=A0ABR9P7P8_9ACTN|nr:ATP-binding protein [Nocardiopsis coralli]MBE2999837.1 ATP-binding protein [Nocardiopsis coralli]